MWELYDRLLAPIPEWERVVSARISPVWTAVEASCGTGLAMTPPQPYRLISLRGGMAGMELRKLAGYVKSWDFYEAALGLAAINAYYNRPERLPEDERILVREGGRSGGIFGGFECLLAGKKVTMIGHGPYVDELSKLCDFTVLERLPREGDLPDSACEYLLPQQDYVFVTATALENKTMARLLALTEHCFTVIWGPSTPLCPALLEMGADALLGNMVSESRQVMRIAGEGGYFQDFSAHACSVTWFRDLETAKLFAR